MDRISGLADELLIKILSSLPTKVAVSTSILSKRWEYLWMWLSNLEFAVDGDSVHSKCNRLCRFLDRSLPLHRAPAIECFRLGLDHSHFRSPSFKKWVGIVVSHCLRELEIDCRPPSFKKWVGIVVSHRLRELEIDCRPPEKRNILPDNLYTCKSLVILKLRCETFFDVPDMVFLPSLKTLQLHRVRYYNEESLPRLLSKCPVLEDLSVDLYKRDFMGKLTVDVPTLLSLSLYVMHDDIDISEVVIETPSLKYLKLQSWGDNNGFHYLFGNLPNLSEADLDIGLPNVNSIIKLISSVKRLTICLQGMHEEGIVFNQLEHLRLCRCKYDSSDLLFRLLKDSPNLKVLDLYLNEEHYIDQEHNWNEPSTIPECMLSSLQTFNWERYVGDAAERKLAVYFLKNAAHLKTATFESLVELFTKFGMIKQLAFSSRASTTCELIFN